MSGDILAPQQLAYLECMIEAVAAPRMRNAVGFILLPLPSHANPEIQTAFGKNIECRGRLRQRPGRRPRRGQLPQVLRRLLPHHGRRQRLRRRLHRRPANATPRRLEVARGRSRPRGSADGERDRRTGYANGPRRPSLALLLLRVGPSCDRTRRRPRLSTQVRRHDRELRHDAPPSAARGRCGTQIFKCTSI